MITIDGLIVKSCLGVRKITMKLEIGKIYYLNNENKNNDFIKSLINYKLHSEIKINNELLGIIYISNAGYLINEFSGTENIRFYQKQFKASAKQVNQLIEYFGFSYAVKLQVSKMDKCQKKILNIICLLLNQRAQVLILEALLIDLDETTISKMKAYIKKIKHKYVILYVSCHQEDTNFLNFSKINVI